MEKKALHLWHLYTQQPRLWSGWRHKKTPLGFHDSEKAVLFGHPCPPKGFIEKEGEGVKYHIANPKPLSFTANSAVDLNGIPTATIMWNEREEEAMLGLISHEAFHAHQMTAGCPMGQIALAMQYPVNNAEVQALAEVEAILLQIALTDPCTASVKAALDARAARQALLSPDLAKFEDEVELGEGLATYIEINTAGPRSDLWKDKLEKLSKLNRNAWGADRLRFYYSGMAWGLLCDRYAPDWQQVEWRTLAGLVAKAIAYKPNPERREFPGCDFTQILTRQVSEAEERKEAIRQSLARALPRTGIRVELHVRGNPVGGGWNPMTAVTFPGVGRFHPTGLKYVFDTGCRLDINDCIEKQCCRHIVFEKENMDIRLDGKPLSQGSTQGCLEINGKDCEILIPNAKVRYSDQLLYAEEILNDEDLQ